MQDKELIRFIRSIFDYKRSPSCATPSGNYFWYRKLQELVKLLARNVKLFQNLPYVNYHID